MRYATLFGILVLVLAATTPATATVAVDGSNAVQESNCSFPVERTDATGTTVTVESEPSRIVTLNPSAAQTLWEMGAQDKVVGVTKHAMNLERAESKENVSGAGKTINNEEVVGLEPDLVLVPNATREGHVQKLREAGLTVYHFREAKSVEDISRKTRVIGELTGECAAAEETVGRMQSELATVDAATDGRERPDVIYTFFGYTAGNGTFIDGIIERAGGNNVAADAGIEGYKKVSNEMLVSRDPDWIVRNTDAPSVPKTAAYNGTTAVEKGQVVVINTNWLNRPGPRVVNAITQLAKAFHPEAYAAANATSSPTATETPTSVDSPATDGSGPGFTGVAAAVALACVALLGRRRT